MGNQSVLHAVQIVRRETEAVSAAAASHAERNSSPVAVEEKEDTPIAEEGDAPLNDTLLDLQLSENEKESISTEEERIRKKAHFFVYCNSPCNSMQEGKLRVKCSQCKEGAVIVHQDPCNWQDVLGYQDVELA